MVMKQSLLVNKCMINEHSHSTLHLDSSEYLSEYAHGVVQEIFPDCAGA